MIVSLKEKESESSSSELIRARSFTQVAPTEDFNDVRLFTDLISRLRRGIADASAQELGQPSSSMHNPQMLIVFIAIRFP
jgi:hypothetical protein